MDSGAWKGTKGYNQLPNEQVEVVHDEGHTVEVVLEGDGSGHDHVEVSVRYLNRLLWQRRLLVVLVVVLLFATVFAGSRDDGFGNWMRESSSSSSKSTDQGSIHITSVVEDNGGDKNDNIDTSEDADEEEQPKVSKHEEKLTDKQEDKSIIKKHNKLATAPPTESEEDDYEYEYEDENANPTHAEDEDDEDHQDDVSVGNYVPPTLEKDPELLASFALPGPSKLAAIPACIVSPDGTLVKVGIYVNNYMRQFQGRFDFGITDDLYKTVEEAYELKEVDQSYFDPKNYGAECPPYSMILTSLNVALIGKYRVQKHEGSYIVQGDEFCECIHWHVCTRDIAAFRNYYTARLKDTMMYLPLGPRYEWKYTKTEEIIPIEKRAISFSFHGSLTNPTRKRMMKILIKEETTEKFPEIMAQSATRLTRQWSPEIVKNAGLAPPTKYRDILMESKLVLCPRGHNPESYRLFEVIDAGAIPVLAREDDDNIGYCSGSFDPYRELNAPFFWVDSFEHVSFLEAMDNLLKDEKTLRRMQLDLGTFRREFWTNMTRNMECAMVKNHIHRNASYGDHYNVNDFCDPPETEHDHHSHH